MNEFKFDLSAALAAVNAPAGSVWRSIEEQLRRDSNASRALDRVAREAIHSERDVAHTLLRHLRALVADVAARIVRFALPANAAVRVRCHGNVVLELDAPSAKLSALAHLLPHCQSAIPYEEKQKRKKKKKIDFFAYFCDFFFFFFFFPF
jgi:hypothetical protein